MKPRIDYAGYKTVRLIPDDKSKKEDRKQWFIHRLVAECFVEGKTKEQCFVDHINRVRGDNRASNLRWVTHFENIQNSLALCPVWSLNAKTGETKHFASVREAERITGIDNRNIFSAMLGYGKQDCKTAGGYYWIKAE
jgi:hypothetical protein